MRTKPYSTDLSDEQWAILAPLLPAPPSGGRPREVSLREVVNAIFYKLKHAVVWADLPRDLPPAGTVYDYYAAWSRSGLAGSTRTPLKPESRSSSPPSHAAAMPWPVAITAKGKPRARAKATAGAMSSCCRPRR